MNPANDQNQEMILRAKRGDREAFRGLYQLHVRLVVSRVMRMVGPGPEVDDIVQDVFVELYRSLGRYEESRPFRSWLLGITRNVTLRRLRGLKRIREAAETQHFYASADEWERINARERVRVVYALLAEVNPEQRESFLLHTFEGMSLREIAESNGESLNTVASRVRRLRERLHELVDQPPTRVEKRAEGGA